MKYVDAQLVLHTSFDLRKTGQTSAENIIKAPYFV